MSALFSQLGIDWKLLIAQGVNFFLLLVALIFLVSKPLSRMLEERRKKIESGLTGAEEVKKRLEEIEIMRADTLRDAEKAALVIVTKAGEEAKSRTQTFLEEGHRRADAVLEEARKRAERESAQELESVERKAKTLLREALVATIELDPRAVDDTLIDRALENLKLKSSAAGGSASGGQRSK